MLYKWVVEINELSDVYSAIVMSLGRVYMLIISDHLKFTGAHFTSLSVRND